MTTTHLLTDSRRLAALAICALCVALAASLPGQEHVGQYAQSDVARGAQIYLAQCAACHGLAGNAVAAVDMRIGRFRTAVADDDLKRVIRAGVPALGMPPMKFDDGELNAIVAFIRAGMTMNAPAVAVTIGDAARGRAIVHGRGGCLKCHRINDQGGRSGPDLSGVGSTRSPASLHQSLIEPSKSMLPLNRPIRVVTLEGRVVTGRRLNEDTYTLQLADEQGRLLSFAKSDLREYEIFTTSPMPSYKDALTQEEIADVFAYLLSLKDATAGRGRGRGF